MGDQPTFSAEDILAESAWILHLARNLVGDVHTAEDIAQEVALTATQGPPKRGLALRPWLRRVVRNVAGKQWRKESAHRRDEDAARRRDDVARLTPSTVEVAAAGELLRFVVNDLNDLEEPLRGTLILRYMRGLSSFAIARQMSVPAGTVRWRLQKGLEELRRCMDARHGGDRESWRDGLCCVLLGDPGVTAAVAKAGAKAVVATVVVGLVGVVLWQATDLGTTVPGAGSRSSVATSDRAPAVDVSLESGTRVAVHAPIRASRASSPTLGAGQAGLRMRVTGHDDRPLSGAIVRWPAVANAFAFTDANGHAYFAARPPASPVRARVEVEHEGHATGIVQVVFRVGHTVDVDGFRLIASRALSGRVVGPGGTPIAGAYVFAQPEVLAATSLELQRRGPAPWSEFAIKAVRAGADGRFTLSGLPARRLRILAVAADTTFGWSDVVPVHPQNDAPIEIRLEPLPTSVFITGRVLTPGGLPTRADLRFTWDSPRHLLGGDPRDPLFRLVAGPTCVATDADGRFRFVARHGDRYDVLVQDVAGTWGEVAREGLVAGQKDLVFRLPPAGR